MNLIMRYREAVTFYALAGLVLTIVAIGPDGNAEDGKLPRPRPSSSPAPVPSVTSTPVPTPTRTPAPTPTVRPSTLPPTFTPTPTPAPTPTVTPTPTPTAAPTPHNKAKGLKDGCLVQHKKWLLRVPCPPAHTAKPN